MKVMDAPGTRYKVIERGRRLEVIDTWNGNVPVTPVRAQPAKRPRDLAGAAQSLRTPRRAAPQPIETGYAPKLDQRGRGLLNTQPWYDDKGPRQLVVTEAGQAKLQGVKVVALVGLAIAAVFAYLLWPVSLFVLFFAFNNGARKSLRAASTNFLDGLNQPVSSG